MEKAQADLELIRRYFGEFTELQESRFAALRGLYEEWNAKINVVSRKDIGSLYLNHVLHSLSIAAVAEWKAGTQVIDIGTGGGFPGIPLAIFFPEVQFLLADSIAKKLKVVEAVRDALELGNVTVRHGRAEEIRDRKFDFAVSRAVAPLKDLLAWSRPLTRKGHTQALPNGLICLKGGDLTEEIAASDARPRIVPIRELFREPWFEEKYLLHVAR